MTLQNPVETLGIVTYLMMRSPAHHDMTIDEVRRMVLPAMDARLAVTATTKAGADGVSGGGAPLAFALFARVDDGWDARLRDPQFRLADMPPDAWTSGDNRWLVEALGVGDAAPRFALAAARTVFSPGTTLNLRLRGKDGTIEIGAREV